MARESAWGAVPATKGPAAPSGSPVPVSVTWLHWAAKAREESPRKMRPVKLFAPLELGKGPGWRSPAM